MKGSLNMNYFKNRKQSLIKLIKKSILLTSIATPTIIEMNSANAMLGSLSRNIYRTGITNTSRIQSLVNQFEKISKTNSNITTGKVSSIGFSYITPSLSTNTNKPILQTKITPIKLQPIIKVKGFIYPYGDEPSSNNKTSTSTNPRITDIISPVKTAKSSKIFAIYTSFGFKSPNIRPTSLNNRYLYQ